MTLRPEWLYESGIRKIIAIMDRHAPEGCYRFVGGCVRDAIMGRPSNDVDIATTLSPQLIADVFAAEGLTVIPTGIEHGTVTVVIDGVPYEFTTLRKDVETDGRRAVIEFTQDWSKDAQRRDFRFNALYMDPDGVVYDPTNGGIKDAMTRTITFVGDAELRLREDHLRSLRLFRFMAVLGTDASPEALRACANQREGINTLSGERILKEMEKLLGARHPLPALDAMAATKVYDMVFPRDLFDRVVFNRVSSASSDWQLRFAALFNWDLNAANDVMAKVRFSKADRQRVTNALKAGPITNLGDENWFDSVEQLVYTDGADPTIDRIILTWACGVPLPVEDVLAEIGKIRRLLPRRFPITGQHLKERGITPGPRMGQILKVTEAEWVRSWFPTLDNALTILDRTIERIP